MTDQERELDDHIKWLIKEISYFSLAFINNKALQKSLFTEKGLIELDKFFGFIVENPKKIEEDYRLSSDIFASFKKVKHKNGLVYWDPEWLKEPETLVQNLFLNPIDFDSDTLYDPNDPCGHFSIQNLVNNLLNMLFMSEQMVEKTKDPAKKILYQRKLFVKANDLFFIIKEYCHCLNNEKIIQRRKTNIAYHKAIEAQENN